MRILFIDLSEGKDDADYMVSVKNYNRVYSLMARFFKKLNSVQSETLLSIDKIYIFVGFQELAIKAFSFIMEYATRTICNLKYFSRIHHLFQINKYGIISANDNSDDSIEESESEVIFLSDFLTINSLYFLSCFKNVLGFRKVIKGKKLLYERLLDSEKYLTIGMALYAKIIQNTDKTDYPLIDVLASKIGEHVFAYRTRDINKFRFRYYYSQNHYELFISIIQSLFGTMLIIRCNNDEYSLPNKKNNLLILNVERLSEAKRSELYTEILSKQFSDQLVILVDNDPQDLIGYPKIVESSFIPKNILPEFEGNEFLEKKLEPVLVDMDKILKNFYYLINQSKIDKKTKSEIIKKIEGQRKVTKRIDLRKIDFWYNLELVQTEHLADILQRYKKLVTDRLADSHSKDRKLFVLRRDKQKDFWIIIKNDEVVKKISYSRSKGIKYIAYLVKHYDTKTISDSKLRAVVDKWHGKIKKTAEASTDAKKILQDLIYLFEKQCPELSSLRDCIIISSKNTGCYFEHQNNITVEIEDDSIPNPI